MAVSIHLDTSATDMSSTSNIKANIFEQHSDIQNDGAYLATIPVQYQENEEEEKYLKNVLDRGPFFEESASKNITTLAGYAATLNCRVRNLGNRTVREGKRALFSGVN